MHLFPLRPMIAFGLTLLLSGVTAAAPVAAADEDAGAYLAARSSGAGNDYREAAHWYERALKADPTNPFLLEGSVISSIGVGDLPAAADAARRFMQTGGNSQTANIALLADQAMREDYTGILADAKAGRSVGTLVDGLVAAWAEVGSGRMSEGLAGFDVIAKTRGAEAFGLYHKALALASVGDFEGADDILSGRASGKIEITRRGTLARAQILSQLERNADALALLVQTFGTSDDPGIDVMIAKLKAGETLPYDSARNARDGIAEVFFTLASALDGQANDGYILIYARLAALLRPDHLEAVLMSASLLVQQGQYALATETFAQILPGDPAFHVAEMGRAEALSASGDLPGAIAVLQALAKSHPGRLAVNLALGDTLRRAERFTEAVTAYDAALALVPTPDQRHWVIFYSRGICHERSGTWPAAEADFRMALKLEPDQPQVLNYLGYSFVDKGENLTEALAMIERAVKARPEEGYIVDSLAWAYFRLGRHADAVAPMEKASLLEPVDPIVTDHLGDVYWAVGRTLEARFQWRRALSFKPTDKDAIRIRRKLEVGLDVVLSEEGAPPLPAPANGG